VTSKTRIAPLVGDLVIVKGAENKRVIPVKDVQVREMPGRTRPTLVQVFTSFSAAGLNLRSRETGSVNG